MKNPSTDHAVRLNQDPEAQLQKLAKQQYQHLLRKLSSDEGNTEGERTIPKRSLPFGSEDVTSPTYTAQLAAVEALRKGAGGEFSTKAPETGAAETKTEEVSSASEGLLESALPRPRQS